MIADHFLQKVNNRFGHVPTSGQLDALQGLVGFLFSADSDSLFLLKGYAGTGKSSLMGSLVETMTEMRQKTVLLAPTGRAAKVFATYAGKTASTIHKKIYRKNSVVGSDERFSVAENRHTDTLFVVDEASMINNSTSTEGAVFGTGCLLDDLVHYVYSGDNCRLMFIGDTAQLPPVGQMESPALNASMLAGYGLNVYEQTLTEVVRQSEDSGVLFNATNIRNILLDGRTEAYPKLHIDGFNDTIRISGSELIEELENSYARVGVEDTMVITRSNKRANIYNRGIRAKVLWREDELGGGDQLQVVKNNYFFTDSKGEKEVDFIANGEMVEVLRAHHFTEMYGFRFCDALIRRLDKDEELEVKILLDTLNSESSALAPNCQNELYMNVLQDYAHLSNKRLRYEAMRENPYFNALQVKYGYAVTCHKAQGGEWKNVYLDIGYTSEEHLGEGFYRWLYTAFTRATERLFLVNLPEEFL